MSFPVSLGAALLLCTLLLAGCGPTLDSAMWDCQLAVQKDNAGRSPANSAERARDINACMEARGFRLDASKPACAVGATDSSCYRPLSR